MKYQKELDFIVREMQNAYGLFSTNTMEINQKTKYDLVTDIDENIEIYLSKAIKSVFETDKILGEEMSSDTLITERTWTIDPIDGTCNMASEIGLYGIQCSLIENNDIVLAAIYIPSFEYLITAVKNEGCFFNGRKVCVKKDIEINNAIVSFGDYPHKNSDRLAQWQHNAIKKVFGVVAKIRMFGSACIDFSFVATGKTDGTVVITRNLWDIAPGMLICKEAGAAVVDLYGNEFSEMSEGVIVGSNEEIVKMLVESFDHKKNINPMNKEKNYDGVIFDFDGVILDTEKYHFIAWNEAFAKYDVQFTPEEYDGLKSTGRENIIKHIIEKYNLKLSSEEKDSIAKEKGEIYSNLTKDLNKSDFVLHVLEYLAFLKKNFVKIGIASSGKSTRLLLDQFGLSDYFDVIIDGNATLNKKPDPAVFLEAARIMNVSPERCLVFEDAPVGITAAKNGGFDVVYVGSNQIDGIANIKDFSEFSRRYSNLLL